MDDAVAFLLRNTSTGELTGQGCVGAPGDVGGCGGATQGGLVNARSVVVDPDGSSVYVVGGDNSGDGAVVRLQRGPNGTLSPLPANSCVMPTGGAAGCTIIQDGLEDVYDIAISANGDSLHAVSRNGGAIFSFSAPGLGSLGCVLDQGDTVPSGCDQAEGLAAAGALR